MWEARTRSDYYTVSLDNGERKQIAKADYGRFRLSPQGKYAYWYGETDSCWYTIALAEGKRYRLTTPESFRLGTRRTTFLIILMRMEPPAGPRTIKVS